MVCDFGMSDRVGPAGWVDSGADGLPVVSTEAARAIDTEIRRFVDEAHERALAILRAWRGALDRVAEALLVRETLAAEELASLSGAPPGRAEAERRVPSPVCRRVRRGRRGGLAGALVLVLVGGALVVWSDRGGSQPRLVGGNLPVDVADRGQQLAGGGARPDRSRPAGRDQPGRQPVPVVRPPRLERRGRGVVAGVAPVSRRRGAAAPVFRPRRLLRRRRAAVRGVRDPAGAWNTPNALWLTVSADGGRTFEPPRRLWGPLAFGPRVVAGRDPDRAGRVWLVWLQVAATQTLGIASTNNPVLVARSDDGGSSWAGPFPVGGSAGRLRALAPAAARGRDGRLYVAYLDLGDDVLDYSGAHAGRPGDPYPGPWSEAVVDAAVSPADRIVSLFPPTPSLAVDPRSGRVYVALADGRSGDPDVLLWTSPDGVRFDPPVRVNDTRPGDGGFQYLPAVAVSSSGRVDVVYYDRRRDPAGALNDVSLQIVHRRGPDLRPVAAPDRPAVRRPHRLRFRAGPPRPRQPPRGPVQPPAGARPLGRHPRRHRRLRQAGPLPRRRGLRERPCRRAVAGAGLGRDRPTGGGRRPREGAGEPALTR